MFEAAEQKHKVSKEEYESESLRLRRELLDGQRALRAAPFPLIVLFGGVDGAGKSETVRLLNEWMDPRWIVNHAFDQPTQDERERPPFWRYWLTLPPRGQVGLFLSAWYSQPLLDRVWGRTGRAVFDRQLARIAAFEQTLANDGALILKFWMHLGKGAQRKRLKALEKDPLTRWRVTKAQWANWKRYDAFIEATERLIEQTSFAHAPWTIVDGGDARYRTLAVTTRIRDALRARLEQLEASPPKVTVRRTASTESSRTTATVVTLVERVDRSASVLTRLDMTQQVSKAEFKANFEKLRGRLNVLQQQAAGEGRSLVLVFEGWDAAGKGGSIRRLVSALEPRTCRIHPIAAPTDEERARHYLWRFWRHLPRAGRVSVYDRSWYGRVLVERVEGFAGEAEWRRAYAEINEFERQLTDHGIIIVKYWLHITKDEQERRFRERAASPLKSWKITDEDWRNREKWEAYELAINDMVAHTSTREAPWHLVEANDKSFARLKVLRVACDALRGR